MHAWRVVSCESPVNFAFLWSLGALRVAPIVGTRWPPEEKHDLDRGRARGTSSMRHVALVPRCSPKVDKRAWSPVPGSSPACNLDRGRSAARQLDDDSAVHVRPTWVVVFIRVLVPAKHRAGSSTLDQDVEIKDAHPEILVQATVAGGQKQRVEVRYHPPTLLHVKWLLDSLRMAVLCVRVVAALDIRVAGEPELVPEKLEPTIVRDVLENPFCHRAVFHITQRVKVASNNQRKIAEETPGVRIAQLLAVEVLAPGERNVALVVFLHLSGSCSRRSGVTQFDVQQQSLAVSYRHALNVSE